MTIYDIIYSFVKVYGIADGEHLIPVLHNDSELSLKWQFMTLFIVFLYYLLKFMESLIKQMENTSTDLIRYFVNVVGYMWDQLCIQ